jgi:hypothetical protein
VLCVHMLCYVLDGDIGFSELGLVPHLSEAVVFRSSEKGATLAQKLGQLQPFIAVFLQE